MLPDMLHLAHRQYGGNKSQRQPHGPLHLMEKTANPPAIVDMPWTSASNTPPILSPAANSSPLSLHPDHPKVNSKKTKFRLGAPQPILAALVARSSVAWASCPCYPTRLVPARKLPPPPRPMAHRRPQLLRRLLPAHTLDTRPRRMDGLAVRPPRSGRGHDPGIPPTRKLLRISTPNPAWPRPQCRIHPHKHRHRPHNNRPRQRPPPQGTTNTNPRTPRCNNANLPQAALTPQSHGRKDQAHASSCIRFVRSTCRIRSRRLTTPTSRPSDVIGTRLK